MSVNTLYPVEKGQAVNVIRYSIFVFVFFKLKKKSKQIRPNESRSVRINSQTKRFVGTQNEREHK